MLPQKHKLEHSEKDDPKKKKPNVENSPEVLDTSQTKPPIDAAPPINKMGPVGEVAAASYKIMEQQFQTRDSSSQHQKDQVEHSDAPDRSPMDLTKSPSDLLTEIKSGLEEEQRKYTESIDQINEKIVSQTPIDYREHSGLTPRQVRLKLSMAKHFHDRVEKSLERLEEIELDMEESGGETEASAWSEKDKNLVINTRIHLEMFHTRTKELSNILNRLQNHDRTLEIDLSTSFEGTDQKELWQNYEQSIKRNATFRSQVAVMWNAMDQKVPNKFIKGFITNVTNESTRYREQCIEAMANGERQQETLTELQTNTDELRRIRNGLLGSLRDWANILHGNVENTSKLKIEQKRKVKQDIAKIKDLTEDKDIEDIINDDFNNRIKALKEYEKL